MLKKLIFSRKCEDFKKEQERSTGERLKYKQGKDRVGSKEEMDFKPATFRRGTILSCNRNEENALMVDANDFGSLYGEDEEIPNRW